MAAALINGFIRLNRYTSIDCQSETISVVPTPARCSTARAICWFAACWTLPIESLPFDYRWSLPLIKKSHIPKISESPSTGICASSSSSKINGHLFPPPYGLWIRFPIDFFQSDAGQQKLQIMLSLGKKVRNFLPAALARYPGTAMPESYSA